MNFLTMMRRHPAGSYRLVNTTRGVVLAETIEGAFDAPKRRRGLLGRDRISERAAFLMAPSSTIHTFTMKFPIDALFVNRRGVVLKQVTALKQWRVAGHLRAFAVIEFAAHHPGVARCGPGDVLEVQPVSHAAVAARERSRFD